METGYQILSAPNSGGKKKEHVEVRRGSFICLIRNIIQNSTRDALMESCMGSSCLHMEPEVAAYC